MIFKLQLYMLPYYGKIFNIKLKLKLSDFQVCRRYK